MRIIAPGISENRVHIGWLDAVGILPLWFGTGSQRASALLDELVRSATPLLSVLNALTLVYEEQSKRHALQQRRQMHELMGDIKTIAREARMVAFNAQIVAARAGPVGREFAVVASTMTNITGEIDALVQTALEGSLAY